MAFDDFLKGEVDYKPVPLVDTIEALIEKAEGPIRIESPYRDKNYKPGKPFHESPVIRMMKKRLGKK